MNLQGKNLKEKSSVTKLNLQWAKKIPCETDRFWLNKVSYSCRNVDKPAATKKILQTMRWKIRFLFCWSGSFNLSFPVSLFTCETKLKSVQDNFKTIHRTLYFYQQLAR